MSMNAFAQVCRSLVPAILLLAAPLPGAEITTGQLSSGTRFETSWFSSDSGEPGPTVLIVGGIHGNEPAGVLAADQIRHWPVISGKLIVIPRANPPALAAGERCIPDMPEGEPDLNRSFPKTDAADAAAHEPAAELWAFVKAQQPDWVLDLHEGYAIHRQNPDSVGSSILCHPDEATKPHFEHALAAVNASIEDPTKLFVLKPDSMTANGSLVRASMERVGAIGAILETTYKEQPMALRVRQHRLMVHRILRNLGMIENGPDDLVFRDAHDERIHVAIYEDGGVFGSGPGELRRKLGAQSDQFIYRVIGGPEVRAGKLADFDIVLFPGGSGSKQAASLGEEGREEVRTFIAEGGGYLGICGGCYLACENFSWGLKILDARTRSSKWRRGRAELDLVFQDGLHESLNLTSAKQAVRYVNGPVMEPAGSDLIPDYEVVALFGTEVADNGTPEGLQTDTPAILRGSFGEGRVVGISPHPESSEGLRDVVPRLLEWAGASLER